MRILDVWRLGSTNSSRSANAFVSCGVPCELVSQKSALRDIRMVMRRAIDESRFGHEDAAAGIEQPSIPLVCCSALTIIALFIDETEFKVGYALQV